MRTAKLIVRVVAFISLLSPLTNARVRAAEPLPPILLTADTEGHADPCRTCPKHAGLGGMDRRATLVARVRKEQPATLLVDAGNAMFGSESLHSRGQLIVSAYDLLAYDAVNLTPRDFVFGKDQTLSLIKAAKFPAVSANLLDAQTNQRLAKPYVVRGGVALVGVSEPVTGVEFLPHLKGQLAGVNISPPLEALADVVPAARKEAGRVVLLYYGSPAGLKQIREKFADALDLILVGGIRPEIMPGGGAPPVVATNEHGKHLARVVVSGAGHDAKAETTLLPVDEGLEPDAKMAAVVARYRPTLRPNPAAVSPDGAQAAVAPEANAPVASALGRSPGASLPTSPQVDHIYPLFGVGSSRGVRLTVLDASLTTRYGPLTAREGTRLVVLGTEWENVIPLTFIEKRNEALATIYTIPNLADHVYLVLDGQRVARLEKEAKTLPGHVPVKDFALENLGDRLRGNLVFEVPGGGDLGWAEVRFYDFAHGHMTVPLGDPAAEAQAKGQLKPAAPLQKNEVVEAAVFGVERKPEWDGAKAPDGMTYVVADLRARSMFTYPGDATAFDPKAKPGAKMQIGTVADWAEAHKYCQLVVDGERAYMPIVPGTTLPEAPRFLPDVMTGGHVVFLAPADAKSLELRCDFPNAKKPDGQVIRPKGVLLPLEGKRPALAQRKPIASVNDDVYRVSVTAQATPQTFAGSTAPEGKRLLVLDILVQNVGQNGELFQTKEQLKCATSDGAHFEIDPLTFQGVYRPTELVFIPSHERRTFQVAYAIPASETRPRLAYGGISLAKNLDLQPIEASEGIAVANAAPAPVPAPAPKTAQPAPAKPQAAEVPKTQVAANVPPKSEPPKLPPNKQVKSAEVKVLRVPAKQPHQPKGIAGVGLKPEQVNQSIERGAAFLWNYIKENDLKRGYQLGYRQEHMLAALALVHADAHKTFPDFDAAVRKYISTFNPLQSSHTYLNGIYCMLIDAYGDPTYLPQMRTTAQWLLDTQGPDGTWGYGIDVKKDPAAVSVRRVLQVAGGHAPDQPAGGEPLVRTTKWEEGADGDNSVTQYALLGLHAAGRFDVKIPKETWERTLQEHRRRQDEKEGGFAYTTGGPGHTYGSMTCAGICALALARHEIGVEDFANDEDIERGLAWMSNYFTVEGNPHPAYNNPKALGREWHYYYLYSLERVGRILDTEFIGSHEWYPLGAKYLLSNQRAEDGGWLSKSDRDDPVLSTAFALLFLTRATESLDLPKRSGPGTLKTAVATGPSTKIHVILDCSGSMLEEMEGRPKFDIAREAVISLVEALPEQAEFGLRVYGHRKRATEEGASDDTELLVPIGGMKREVLQAKLKELRARGKTPMAKSLSDAKRDVRSATEENPIVVILLTDGGEDSQPRRDPLKAAEEFGAIPGVRLHVVGFDINRPDWVEQLQGMAARARGQYLPAQQSDALQRELKSAVFGTPEGFALVDAHGKPAGGGEFGQSIALPEGKYTFRTNFAGKTFEQPFWINAGSTTAVTFDAAQVAKEQGVANASPAAPKKPAPPAAADAAPTPAPAPAASGNKFCTSCGTKRAAGTKFCTNCGAKQ